MKTLCKYLGGSHLYGMETPASDVDERGVFMNTDPLYVYGFHRLDNQVNQTAEEDVVMHELTQFLTLATKSNTQTLECLFAPREAFTELHEDFKTLVLTRKYAFLNSAQLFKSLRGYLQNEMRLAVGERTGTLGSKRKNQLELHGFSPKNFTHLFRLAECGRQFFETSEYPVRLKDFNPDLHDFCMALKTHPEQFVMEELVVKANELSAEMEKAFENRKVTFQPDEKYCGVVLQHFYSNYA
jgi:predicted nucleotidyltransferase